ncbi:class II glutamine amidotransferase [Acrocarpospora catenulata]|uniref:class II glutamine amidotransferase n=1 Tax=Acrocarpospora catenulata TaxID=2836182 RepID=UPI001BDA390F|nr:class II glutamine amidotransferase [Acrocarpospora catenulata]
MCGITAIQVRDAALRPKLGELITAMLGQVADRGPDSAGIMIYPEKRVLKGVGHPTTLATEWRLHEISGTQAIAHTRMATESAITAAHCHPFVVGDALSLVHNGSFANHHTIRRELTAQGVEFDSDNDSEVAARFLAYRMAQGDDLEKAIRLLCERFDGFYTLAIQTPQAFAVVRDIIACKPAIIAETPGWVAMASEYRALAVLPGIESARVYEPEPEEVYLWTLT